LTSKVYTISFSVGKYDIFDNKFLPGTHMTKVAIVILDFDGVILESVSVKTDAFRKLFSFSPQHVDVIVRFHLDNGGISRFDKFRHIFRVILNEELSDEKFQNLSDKFSMLVEDAVVLAPFVAGVSRFLESTAKRYPLYIVSATPEEELKRIVHNKGISHYFAGVFGSPAKKVTHIQGIIAKNHLKKSEVIFVGDAVNDLVAAQDCGIRFIGRVKPGDTNIFEKRAGVEHIIADFDDLFRYLEDRK